jgi:hypothetical protein
MSEFFVNTCNQCNKNDHDEHVVFHEQGICHDCHTIPKLDNKEEQQYDNDCNICIDCNEEECDMFGEPTDRLCDACGGSIDPTLIQVYPPGIFCPDCLIGMGQAYEKRIEIEHKENIAKIANYMPLIFEKLKEIEKNTNPTVKSLRKSLQKSVNESLQESIYESLQESFNESLNESFQGSLNEHLEQISNSSSEDL